MFRSVLVPTDGSEAAFGAAQIAIDLAAALDASLLVLYVIDDRFVLAGSDAATEASEREAEAALERIGDAAAPRPVEKLLRRGISHRQIVSAVDDHGVDLVVMGRHGRSGVDRLVHLGSTTDRVVRTSPVPVLAVPP